MSDRTHKPAGGTMPPQSSIDRRELFRRAGAVGAAAAASAVAGPLAPTAFGAGPAQEPSSTNEGKYLVPRHRIGCGMVSYGFVSNYSILDEIRDIGYRATELIQFTGFPGGVTRAREVRHLLQEANLVGVGNMHYLGFGGPDVANSLDRFIAEDKAAGMRNFGFVAHRTTPATQTEAYYRELAHKFNEWGAATKKAGMRFYVHNESWVFDRDPTTGKVLYDVWIEETDPDLVYFNVDTAWMSASGLDLVEYVEKLERDDRITHFHIKEWNGTPQVTPSPQLGTGVIDWPRFFKALKKPEKYWYILESEGQSDPKASALAAYDYLATLKG